ncbi:LexA family protein [Methylovorus glucosotrophus]|uniref:LexA family protein n=1 Tax=Methylovorus glucosotrophus TaxID=266009 RepID=UPI0013313A21|nr:translesion error-prone DNA polymerase V autoproteolytic subunit [Methylovorus glucosotrophus]
MMTKLLDRVPVLTAATIPLYDNPVAAGFPSPAADHVEDRLSADDYLVVNPTATYFVRVKGDSMIDAGIFDGDVLVVDRSITPSLGHVVLAEVDGEFTVKYLGRGKLLPANSSYQSIFFKEGQTVEIIGVVTGSMRRFV